MRLSSCCFSSSFSCLALSARILARRSSSIFCCSSLLNFGLDAAGSISSGTSMSASSACSASQLIAFSSDSLPGWYGQGESAYKEKCTARALRAKSLTCKPKALFSSHFGKAHFHQLCHDFFVHLVRHTLLRSIRVRGRSRCERTRINLNQSSVNTEEA